MTSQIERRRRHWGRQAVADVGVTCDPRRCDSRLRPTVNNLSAYSSALDDELVSWSAGGDRRAFDEIVIRHGPFALRVACRFIPDRSGAEDVAQEAMVRAWSEARHFDPVRARFQTWLYRIVVNLCIDQRRRIQPKPLP